MLSWSTCVQTVGVIADIGWSGRIYSIGRLQGSKPAVAGSRILAWQCSNIIWSVCSRSVNTAISTSSSGRDIHLVSGHVLELGETPELLVHGVDHEDVDNTDGAEQHPGEEGEYVVAKDEIIDKGAVAKVHYFPRCEHRHCHQPSYKSCLILQSESIQQKTGGHEQSDRPSDADEACEDKDVPDVMVADIDELV